jgi:hypothetical protein
MKHHFSTPRPSGTPLAVLKAEHESQERRKTQHLWAEEQLYYNPFDTCCYRYASHPVRCLLLVQLSPTRREFEQLDPFSFMVEGVLIHRPEAGRLSFKPVN